MNKLSSSALTSYVSGFVLSLLLTVAAFLVVQRQLFDAHIGLIVIVALAVLQFGVQVICFLHLGQETGPKWNLRMFWFMLLVVVGIVVGSLWIMNNLNYHMMDPHETDAALKEQSKSGF